MQPDVVWFGAHCLCCQYHCHIGHLEEEDWVVGVAQGDLTLLGLVVLDSGNRGGEVAHRVVCGGDGAHVVCCRL